MTTNNKATLSVLQQEFAEKLKAYKAEGSASISKIENNIKAMEENGLEPEDYMQLGPFSCRNMLIELGINPTEFRKNKALIMGFLADTFTERGFNVNLYNIVPETGKVAVQKIEPVPEAQRPQLELSTWDNFWAFFGFETANYKAVKGFEEAKAKEAEASQKMQMSIVKEVAERNAVANILSTALPSSLDSKAGQVFDYLKKGQYVYATEAAVDYLKDRAREEVINSIDEQELGDKMTETKIKSLQDKAVNNFSKKFKEANFLDLSATEKALALANIISDPAKISEACKCTLKEKISYQMTQKPGKSGVPVQVKKKFVSFDVEVNQDSLAKYVPSAVVEVHQYEPAPDMENNEPEIDGM